MDLAKEFIMLLTKFTKQKSLKSVDFKYYSIFLDTVVPVLKNLTDLFQERVIRR